MRPSTATTLVGIIVVATLAATARAGTTIDEFRLKQDERLAARWADNDVDGVLDGVEEIQLRLPQEPLAQMWLSVVISAEGMPETGMAVGAAPSRKLASSQGARVLDEQRKTALRTIEFTVAAEGDASLAPADKAALERGVRAWLAQWTPQPEAQPTSPSSRLRRALALLGTTPTPPGKALVTVAWQGPVLGVRAIGGARTATLPELGIRVGSFAPMVVGAKDLLAAKAPLPLRLQRVDEFRRTQDERLAARWADNDVDGVLKGVEEIQLRLPQEPLAQLWLSVVIAAEGMPETGMAVGAVASRTLASSQGARVLDEQRKTALRTIEFTVAAEENAPLVAADKAALERGVRAWLAQWTPQPEAQPTSPSPRLRRALALLGTTPPGKALVTVAWQGPVLGVRAIAGARTATLPELGVRVGSFAPMVVGAKDLLAAKAPLPLRLQRPLRAMLTGIEPDEQLTIAGQRVAVLDGGRTAELELTSRVRVLRRLGDREREDEVKVTADQHEAQLPPWPELARARERFGAGLGEAALTAEEGTLLQSLCSTPHGAGAERLLDGLMGAPGGLTALLDMPVAGRVLLGAHVVPVVRCRGKAWIGLARGEGDVALTLNATRTVTVRAADRARGERALLTQMTLTAHDGGFRYRVAGASEWRALDVPIPVAPATREVIVDVARPQQALQRLTLTPVLGEAVQVALVETDTGVRDDAVAWSEEQGRRPLGFGLIAVPGALAVVGLGLVGGGAVFYGRAEEAAAAYELTNSSTEASSQRDQVEARVGLANLLTQAGVASAGLAVVTTALPALWLLVWNPDSPAPPDFPTK